MADHQVVVLLADLALIVGVAKLAGAGARRLGQPAVIGETVAGILLGPTLLHGLLARTLFPQDIRPFLTALADLGLVLFMFVVGMEIEHAKLRGTRHLSGATALGAAALPFAVGVPPAIWLAGHHTMTNRPAFVLLVAVALAVTAFPVLARIITDRGLAGTSLGTIALSAAAVCDVVAWTMLAVAQAIAGTSGSHWQVLLVVPYVAVIVWVVRPLLRRLLPEDRTAAPGVLAVLVAGLLLSSAATQLIGLHFVFGAFLFGLVTPRPASATPRQSVNGRIEFATGLLLPIYFVVTGLNVNLSGIGGSGVLDLCVVIAAATVGKLVGAFAGARLGGMLPRQAGLLAVLMNTRGLTELIVLSIGREAGLLDQRIYSILVVMAIVTTAMTGPLLQLLTRSRGASTLELFDTVHRADTRRADAA